MDVSHLPTGWGVVGLLFGVVVVYQAYCRTAVYLRRRALQREKGTLLPPWYTGCRDHFLGLDLFWETFTALKEHRLLEGFANRFATMGVNTMQMRLLGIHVYLTIEPEILKTIQANEFKKWELPTRRKQNFRQLLGDGIFTTDGAAWQHSRQMLKPNFVRAQVGDLAMFEKHIRHLIDAVPGGGSTVDLSELFFRLTIDSATEFLFGESTNSLADASGDDFANSFNRSQTYVANGSRWGPLAKLFPANKHWEHDRNYVHKFVGDYVDNALVKHARLAAEDKEKTEKTDRYVFIDELVRQTQDRIRIRSECLNILLAGRDTTASLLTNVWFVLSKRPDIWRRLQAEIAVLNGKLPTYEQLKDLKYVEAVLKESLRLHPVVPINSREAAEDTTLSIGGGPDGLAPLFVRKGEVVLWSVYVMHRRKDLFGEDAEEFRPERWLDDLDTGRKGLRTTWEYLPFNGGPRVCMGQQYALNEASYTTIRLCQAFKDLESRDSEPWKECFTLTVVNLGGAKVALTPR